MCRGAPVITAGVTGRCYRKNSGTDGEPWESCWEELSTIEDHSTVLARVVTSKQTSEQYGRPPVVGNGSARRRTTTTIGGRLACGGNHWTWLVGVETSGQTVQQPRRLFDDACESRDLQTNMQTAKPLDEACESRGLQTNSCNSEED